MAAQYDVVVYGATMPGIAAVHSLRAVADQCRSVLVINPQPEVGGIGVAGAQNFWDVREWTVGDRSVLPQRGSCSRWYETQGQAYDTSRMAATLRDELDVADVTVKSTSDVTAVRTDSEGRIVEITLVPIEREDGETSTGSTSQHISGSVFVDASESGRLTRLAGVSHAVGREDWAGDSRQMAATLMFLVDDIDWDTIVNATDEAGQPVYGTRRDPIEDKRLFWGGESAVTADPVEAFRAAYPRLDIKAMNAAEHAEGQFWLNTVLAYDVDGRYDARDRDELDNTESRSPWDRDQAYRRLEDAIGGQRFTAALQAFPGFETARVAQTDGGDPVVGDVLYLRETIHTDDGGFTLSRKHVEDAGEGPETGADSSLYDSRIGLAYYWLDNNGYARPRRGEHGSLEPTDNPAYVPYEALVAESRPNLLLPGYATRISSEAWFELRVLPNLCVLGDAAGAAAAVALEQDTEPARFDQPTIRTLQHALRRDCNAVLDKRTLAGRTEPLQQTD